MMAVGLGFISPCAIVAKNSKDDDHQLVSRSVGRLNQEIVTSREVYLNQAIEVCLYAGCKESDLHKTRQVSWEDQQFKRWVTGVLLEQLMMVESQGLKQFYVTENEVKRATAQIKQSPAFLEVMNWLEPSELELKKQIQRKLKAKKFISYKVTASVVPVTEQEVRKYYDDNKVQFVGRPFEEFRGNIREYLVKQQVDQRLADWFNVLKSKHNLENQLFLPR